MSAASFRNPQSGPSDSEQAANTNQEESSPLLGPRSRQTSSSTEEKDSMPTKRSLLAANLLGEPKAILSQVSSRGCH